MGKITFENTEIAFSAKSDRDLKRAYWLFRMVGKPWMVKVGKALTNFALKIRFPIKGMIKKTIFKQFCGGETIDECDPTIAQLHKYGIGTILDYSVEGKTSDEDFEYTTNEIIDTIKKADANEAIPFAVFKVTGVSRFPLLEKVNAGDQLSDAETAEFEAVRKRVESICRTSYETGTPVFIDAEESWIQNTIDGLANEMMEKYNKEKVVVFNTVQIYRHDRLAFLKKSYEEALAGGYKLGIKLVRGAYMEKERDRAEDNNYPSPIQPDKAACDNDYDAALVFCLEHVDRITLVAGTHNEASSLRLTDLMQEKQLPNNDQRIWFAQLFGMSDHISYNLSNAGYNVAKYVPYGPVREVMPYLIRRAQENTSVAGQTSRELSLIMKEKRRRKGKS